MENTDKLPDLFFPSAEKTYPKLAIVFLFFLVGTTPEVLQISWISWSPKVHSCNIMQLHPPAKTKMTMEQQPFEDVSPIKNCYVPLSC